MDISKASNFERYVFDLLGRDTAALARAWKEVEEEGMLDLTSSVAHWQIAETGFVSGSSTHADRLATIRSVWEKYGVMIDTHTADGVKVGLEHRDEGIPLVCLETALAAKFSETIREALGRDPERPAAYADIESRPQRFEVMGADANAVKTFIRNNS
jgi:threonine synthase